MRLLILLLAFEGFIFQTIARPHQSAESYDEIEKAEYGNSDGVALEDYLSDKSDERRLHSKNKENYETQRAELEGHRENLNLNTVHSIKQHPLENNGQYESRLIQDAGDRKIVIDSRNHDETASLINRRKLNTNIDNEDVDEDEENIPPSQITQSGYQNKRNNGRKLESNSNDEENNFYEDDRRFVNDKNDYNNEPNDVARLEHLKHNSYNNKKEIVSKGQHDDIFLTNRNRRQVISEHNEKENNKETKSLSKDNEIKLSDEDNESAIKRNIKKLSREELEDLFNSLSDDKKALLRKIIDNKFDNVNKREITKKAGAVEEINCLENGQSDFNKIESARSLVSSSPSLSDVTESTKQTDVNDVSTTKTSETESSSPKSDSKEELADENPSLKQDSILENTVHNVDKDKAIDEINADLPKTENKRDTSVVTSEDKPQIDSDELPVENQYSLGNDEEFSKDDSWSELMKEESELHKSFKRDISDAGQLDNIKFLEESFPNYDSLDIKTSNSQMAPLIRVKRTDHNAIKRKMEHNQNTASYYSMPLDDAISDNKKSEFNDGGIFRQASNYEKLAPDERLTHSNADLTNKRIQKSVNKSDGHNVNSEVDTANIGSDTDNVLSNVEGVDDNLMYNNGNRKKRVFNDINYNEEVLNVDNNELKSSPNLIASDKDDLTQNAFNQENDAFGPVPHNSNDELGRHKRIRSLNPSSMRCKI